MAAVKPSKTLIIVIAVSGSLGCVAILFLIFKFCRRSKPVPLPPIQPLAHRREKELNYLPRPYIPRDGVGLGQSRHYGSDTPLLKPSRKRSFQTDESHGTPSSSQHSFSVLPSPSTNVTHQPSPLSVESNSDEQTPISQQYVPTTHQARPASRTRSKQPRSRTDSTTSTQSTSAHAPTRSGNIIRGAPHSSLSNVQIVLPTPLAPQLLNHMVTNPSIAGSCEELVERGGIADGWTTTPGRMTSRRSNSDRRFSKRDASRGRKAGSSSGHRDRHSLDAIDRPRRLESRTQSRGQISSRNPIQSQPLRATPQNIRNGRATQPPPEQGRRPSSRTIANSRSRSLSLSRSHQLPSYTKNLPFPQPSSHSSHRYTPSSSADTLNHHSTSDELSPPPVPPLPGLPQKSSMQAEHTQSLPSDAN